MAGAIPMKIMSLMGVLTVLVISLLIDEQKSQFIIHSHTSGEPKIVLDWTGYFCEVHTFSKDDNGIADSQLLTYWSKASAYWCPNLTNSCLFTGDRSFASSASAILFHVRQIGWTPKMIPSVRHPWQRYIVMHTREAPQYRHADFKEMDDLFNERDSRFDFRSGSRSMHENQIGYHAHWTMTYRRDSDIPFELGYIERTNKAPQMNKEQLRALVRNKSKLVAWFVSNCPTPAKMEEYVNELQKHIQVDIYGACGPLKCPQIADFYRTQEAKCLEMLKSDYLFYISFENCVCDHYITEKLYSRLNDYVVLLVLRGSDYNQTGVNGSPVAPPNSYIAVDAFENPKQLAEYLKWLSNNTEEYLKYFEWRKEWNSTSLYYLPYKVMCDVCEKLHKDDEPWTGLTTLDWSE